MRFWNAMQNAGYKSLQAFCVAARLSNIMVKKMSEKGEAPKDDVVTYRVAGLLNVAPPIFGRIGSRAQTTLRVRFMPPDMRRYQSLRGRAMLPRM